jgi:fructose/tagatose bisphosphate aldolase
MSESKWKQVVGKKISEGAYVSADELRKDYLRAMEETTFTQKVGDDVQKIAKLEALKLFAKASGYKDEDIAKIAQLRLRKRNLTTDEEIEEIERVLAEKKQKEETCTDGEHCQEIVSEGELAKFLGEGWKLVAALPSGKIVIGR